VGLLGGGSEEYGSIWKMEEKGGQKKREQKGGQERRKEVKVSTPTVKSYTPC